MKVIKPLTIKQIDNAKPIAKPYRLYDGGGCLSLLVKSTAKTLTPKPNSSNN
ncbi:hypothetical protein [Moraxella nonliquefaciens]|uniref:hypothetical protein n=1 Tax=Moraxella nonliquefaciens TaxID=478 RepID=UPI001EF3F328|nr:hypothetical protein [Moraxella nonliquefaciens]MCG7411071.1 hypothetical protein [Moraxella nonliquefaciens]